MLLSLAAGVEGISSIVIASFLPVRGPAGVFAAEALPKLTVTADQPAVCQQRYTGGFLGVNAGKLVDGFHFLSAGAASFARGLNDTPRIAALLLVASALNIKWGLVAITSSCARTNQECVCCEIRCADHCLIRTSSRQFYSVTVRDARGLISSRNR